MWEKCHSWTDRDQIWHTYASGNVHELKIKPLIPEGHGVRGSSIHKFGKALKPLDRSGPNLAHVYRFIGEWKYAKKINPSSAKGLLKGVWGSQIQKYWKDAKQLSRPIVNKFCTRVQIRLHVNGHSWLKKLAPWDTTWGVLWRVVLGVTYWIVSKLPLIIPYV